ncbi:MAG TPA: NAD-dependent epimerase/dehydratase family protein [Pseudomonadales bacterium]
MKRVLITGGAGFIGSHVTERLLESGWDVRVLDCLEPQVHGDDGSALPPHVLAAVDFRRADLRDRQQVESAVQGMDAVIHLAAAVGVGQSMYEICRYTSMNASATAVLGEALIAHPVERLVVASSMSVYGEGLYRAAGGRDHESVRRSAASLDAHEWDPCNPDGEPLEPVPTPEWKRPDLSSIYALTKYHQEQQVLILGRAYGMQATALRLFNVYGPRQSLSNPYTGVLAIFASRLLAGKAPVIFEDGQQCRDFVSVYDVAEAFRLTLENPPPGRVINIGSGERYSVLGVAKTLREALGTNDVPIDISGKYRVGDIRHCFADISLAGQLLGYRPRVRFADGLREYVGWLSASGVRGEDRVEVMRAELAARGLAR